MEVLARWPVHQLDGRLPGEPWLRGPRRTPRGRVRAAAGEPLVLFPEGTRQDGPTVGTLLEGASFLAARTGAPILPVGIAGTDRALPKGAKVPRPVKVHVVIGEAVPAPFSVGGVRVPRHEVAATTEALREGLQRAYDEACGRLSAPAATS